VNFVSQDPHCSPQKLLNLPLYLAPCQRHSPNRNFRDQPQCYLHLHLGAGHPMIGESEAAKENSSRSPTFYGQYTVIYCATSTYNHIFRLKSVYTKHRRQICHRSRHVTYCYSRPQSLGQPRSGRLHMARLLSVLCNVGRN